MFWVEGLKVGQSAVISAAPTKMGTNDDEEKDRRIYTNTRQYTLRSDHRGTGDEGSGGV